MLKFVNGCIRLGFVLIGLAAFVFLYRFLFSAFATSSVVTGAVAGICAVMAVLMLRATARGASHRNHARELAEIFEAFAQRHRLAVNVAEQNATSYTFEAGGPLKHWLVLSVVEGDEVRLDFGDHQFRFLYRPQAREAFERVLDDWIAGRARIVAYSGGGEALETATEFGWTEFLARNAGPLRGRPVRIVSNAA